MAGIALKDLLEAGVHFGHQTKRWNPKMKVYIFGERNGIYIIDLSKTAKLFRDAEQFTTNLAAEGRTILFVGTKRQAQDAVAEEAQRCGMFFVNQRWLGGLAHQLHHDPAQSRAAARSRGDGDRRPLRDALEERDLADREGKAQAAEEPRRHPQHVPAARRALRRRHPQGTDCRRRGAQAEDPGHRRRRHQLRPGRSGLRHSRATTTRCAPSGCSRRASPMRCSRGAACASRPRPTTRDAEGDEPRPAHRAQRASRVRNRRPRPPPSRHVRGHWPRDAGRLPRPAFSAASSREPERSTTWKSRQHW